MAALIDELAKKYKDDHKLDDAGAKEQITQKLTKTKQKTHGTTVYNVCYRPNAREYKGSSFND